MPSTDKGRPIIVVASGVFDLIHYGHLCYLEEAKKAGGEDSKLVVVVARDSTVKRLKGKKPVIPEDQRRAIVEALKPVDEAILGYEDLNIKEVVRKIKPDIVAVGHDQEFIEDSLKEVASRGEPKFRIVKIREFATSDLNSSSKIKRRIIKEWK